MRGGGAETKIQTSRRVKGERGGWGAETKI